MGAGGLDSTLSSIFGRLSGGGGADPVSLEVATPPDSLFGGFPMLSFSSSMSFIGGRIGGGRGEESPPE